MSDHSHAPAVLNWEWLLRHALFPGDFSPASLALLRLAMRALPELRFTLLHLSRASGDGYLQAAGVGDDAVEVCRLGAERRARLAARHLAVQAVHPGILIEVQVLRQPWASAVAAVARKRMADAADAPGAPARAALPHRLRRAASAGGAERLRETPTRAGE